MNDYLKRQEVAEILQVPLRTLDHLVATGEIPFSRIGKRSVRFDRQRLQEWFHDREGVEYRLARGESNVS